MTDRDGIMLDGARRTIELERDYPTARAEVWDAITDRERLARWLGSVTRDGDRYVLDMGEGDVATGEITACEPGIRLEVTWSYGTEAPSRLEVVLADDDAGCTLRLTHGRLQAIGAAGYGAGWEDFLGSLARSLDAPVDARSFEAALVDYRRREAGLVAGGFDRGPAGSSVHLERLLDATLVEVWSALTEPGRIGRWLWPVIAWPDDPERRRSLRLGDSFVLGDPNLPEAQSLFEVIALEELASIAFTWNGVSLSFGISEVDGATLLVLDQGASPDVFGAGRLRSGDDFAAGWHSLLDVLSVTLDGIPVEHPDTLWEAAYSVYHPAD
jgi:uncharacterized protein YndB with AHSA1/START domain